MTSTNNESTIKFSLWGFIEGDKKKQIFCIQVTPNENVFQLKEAIRDKNINRLQNIDASQIVVRKFIDLVLFEPKDTLTDRLSNSISSDEASVEVDNWETLSELWPQVHPQGVHFFVESAPLYNNQQRTLSSINEEEKLPGRDDIAAKARNRDSPSNEAKTGALYKKQRSDQEDALYHGRPHYLGSPSICIFNKEFANFADAMSIAPDPRSFSPEEIDTALQFIHKSVAYYKDERTRQDELAPILKEALSRDGIATEITLHLNSSFIKPEGHHTVYLADSGPVKHPAVMVFTEIKNEIGDGNCDPTAQAQCCYMKVYASKKYEVARNACCCPAFLIAIAGPNIAILGAVFAGRFISQRLTDFIYIGSNDRQNDIDAALLRIIHLLRCLKKSLNALADYYSQVGRADSAVSSATTSQSNQPTVASFIGPHLREYTVGNDVFRLDYLECLAPGHSAKAVFKANAKTKKGPQHQVVVKFTKSYWKSAHALLAEQKPPLAPKLLYCEQVQSVGGLWVVVMDYVPPCAGNVEDVVKDVTTALEILHGKDLVYGDLRTPNVLATNTGAMLIDFDWAGPVDKTFYPWSINLSDGIQWAKGIGRGTKIEQAHDWQMLTFLREAFKKR